MDAVVRCMKAEMLTKADLQNFEMKEKFERFVAKEDLQRILDGEDKMAMNIEDTAIKGRVTESEMHRETRVKEMRNKKKFDVSWKA